MTDTAEIIWRDIAAKCAALQSEIREAQAALRAAPPLELALAEAGELFDEIEGRRNLEARYAGASEL